MKLYIMRHGQAQMVAQTDFERVLTCHGEEETHGMSHWLAEQTIIDTTFSSPYVRAQQTCEIMKQQIANVDNHWQLDELIPESDPANCGDVLLAYCAQYQLKNVLVVSHLPLVGLLIADLCPGAIISDFPPGSIACLEIDLQNWQGQLLWHKYPSEIAQPILSVS